MSQLPLISIVIPHFNRTELLAETLASVRAQEYSNWEVVIVDDGSEESEWAAVQAMAGEPIRVLRREDGQKGPSRCRNLGAAVAAGEFIIFVDSDDIMAPWCLSQRMREVERLPAAQMWVFQVILFEKSPGDLATCWNRLHGDDDIERFLRPDPPWHTSAPLWRRDAFDQVGGFNDNVFGWDDAELHLRALLIDIEYRKYPECLPDVFVRRSDSPRITNLGAGLPLDLLLSRLKEGTKLLRNQCVSDEWSDVWEGRYFVECEELLFNWEEAKREIGAIIDTWVEYYEPTLIREIIVRAYFHLGQLTRSHAYLVLRIMRRLAMWLLPSEFFPRGGEFHRWKVTGETLREIRVRLAGARLRGRSRSDIHE